MWRKILYYSELLSKKFVKAAELKIFVIFWELFGKMNLKNLFGKKENKDKTEYSWSLLQTKISNHIESFQMKMSKSNIFLNTSQKIFESSIYGFEYFSQKCIHSIFTLNHQKKNCQFQYFQKIKTWNEIWFKILVIDPFDFTQNSENNQ